MQRNRFTVSAKLTALTAALNAALGGCASIGETPDAADAPAASAEQQIVDGATDFAFDLYRALLAEREAAGEDGNLFLSPASLSTAFALVHAGAAGDTRSAIAEVMGYPDDGALHPAMGALVAKLQIQSEPTTLAVNNAAWIDKASVVEEDYLELVGAQYGAGDMRVDYRHDSKAALATINEWVEAKTAGKITDLLTEQEIDEDTRLTLVNTIYMKARWSDEFDARATAPAPFRHAGGASVETPMMQMTSTLPYAETADYKITALSFGYHELSMIVLLPKRRDGLAALEQTLSAASLNLALKKLAAAPETIVDLKLPKWRMEQRHKLKDKLADMGMALAFSDNADFGAMVDPERQPDKTGVKIGDVIHQTFIELDEKGAEAAAATAVEMVQLTSAVIGPPPKRAEFHADHPFVFLIRDNKTGMIVFLGRMENPA